MNAADASGLLTGQITAIGGFAKTVLTAYYPAVIILALAIVAMSLGWRYLGHLRRA